MYLSDCGFLNSEKNKNNKTTFMDSWEGHSKGNYPHAIRQDYLWISYNSGVVVLEMFNRPGRKSVIENESGSLVRLWCYLSNNSPSSSPSIGSKCNYYTVLDYPWTPLSSNYVACSLLLQTFLALMRPYRIDNEEMQHCWDVLNLELFFLGCVTMLQIKVFLAIVLHIIYI